jgi:hypothetical protein
VSLCNPSDRHANIMCIFVITTLSVFVGGVYIIEDPKNIKRCNLIHFYSHTAL